MIYEGSCDTEDIKATAAENSALPSKKYITFFKYINI